MKVVLFCGGQGMRIREYSERVPKPLIPVGNNTPILVNIMKYYAHFGHTDFILALGYMGEAIKDYFVDYKEYKSNNFILKGNTGNMELLNTDLDDWKITFVDTGINSNIGTRLQFVKDFIGSDKIFLASYGDCLTDIELNPIIEQFSRTNMIACFLACRPFQSYHIVDLDGDSKIVDILPMRSSHLWINGGFFVLRNEIFDYMEEGDELVEKPFKRLLKEKRLSAHPYEGFWASMDTFKDKQILDEMYLKGDARWEVWKKKKTC